MKNLRQEILVLPLLGLLAVGSTQAKEIFDVTTGPSNVEGVAQEVVEGLSTRALAPLECPFHVMLDSLDIYSIGEDAANSLQDALAVAISKEYGSEESCNIYTHDVFGSHEHAGNPQGFLGLLKQTGPGTIVETKQFRMGKEIIAVATATSTQGDFLGITDQIFLSSEFLQAGKTAQAVITPASIQTVDARVPTKKEAAKKETIEKEVAEKETIEKEVIEKEVTTSSVPTSSDDGSLTIHGSPALSEGLIQSLALAFLKSQSGSSADEPGVNETTTGQGEHVLSLTNPAPGQLQEIRIRGNGAFQAFDSLQTDRVDIVASYRPVKDSEHATMTAKHDVDMRDPAAEHVIGIAGIEVAVNAADRLDHISRETLRSIYSKEIRSWDDPALSNGRHAGAIHAIGPGAGSNATELFRTLAMEGQPPLYRSSLDWGAAVPRMVAADPNAIAFSTTHVGGSNHTLAIDECGHRYAFEPFSIKTLDHPLSTPLFLYANPSKPSSSRDAFLDFVMSSAPGAGQEIVGQHFTNLDILIADSSTTDERLQAVSEGEPALLRRHDLFQALIADARRVSTTFRFRFDSDTLDLDSRGERELESLVRKIESENISSRQVMLFGFADAAGEASYNLELAARRAEAVATNLSAYGLDISGEHIIAIGEDAPVGCNLKSDGQIDEGGAARNRRVEVWIKEGS